MGMNYKSTDVGMIPFDWQIKTIEQLFEKGFQNGVFLEVDRKGKGVPIVNVSNLYGNFPINTSALERFDAKSEEIDRFGVHKGYLFLSLIHI